MSTTATIPEEIANPLRELADRHMVVFEARPTYQLVDGERVENGYDVELAGTHSEAVLEGKEPHPTPGCERCRAVARDLEQIAAAVLPRGERASRYELHVEPGLTYDPKRRPRPGVDRPDVTLTIEIRHAEKFFAPVDACEDLCLHDIVAGLRSLGVQEATWSPTRARHFRERLAEHQSGSPRAS